MTAWLTAIKVYFPYGMEEQAYGLTVPILYEPPELDVLLHDFERGHHTVVAEYRYTERTVYITLSDALRPKSARAADDLIETTVRELVDELNKLVRKAGLKYPPLRKICSG